MSLSRFTDLDFYLNHIQSQLHIEVVRLDTDPFEVTSQLILFDDIGVSRYSTSTALSERLGLPAGNTMISFNSNRSVSPCIWCGIEASTDCFVIHRPCEEYVHYSPPGFGAVEIMIPDNYLIEEEIVPETIWRNTLLPEQAIFPLTNMQGIWFRDTLFDLFECQPLLDLLKTDVEIVPLFREWILEELTSVISNAVCSSNKNRGVHRLERFEITRVALDLIDDHLEEPFSTSDLAIKMDISPRLLQYAFQDIFKISPLRYIINRKLHAAHTKLIQSKPANYSQVARIAMLYGMHHLGRFSYNYKKLFGESPSTTLRRDYRNNRS